MVMDSTLSAWASALDIAQEMNENLQIVARGNMKLVLEQEVALKGRIIELIAPTLRPFIAEHGARTLRPVLDYISNPISLGFAQGVRYFFTVLNNRFTAGELNTPSKRTQSIRLISRQAEYYWNKETLLFYPVQTFKNLYHHNPLAEDHFPPGAFTLADLKNLCIRNLKDLAFRALHLFLKAAESVTTGKIKDILNNVTKAYLADTKRMVRKTLVEVMKNMMRIYVVELWSPASQAANPIQSVIDNIPTPGLSDLFHVQCLIRDVIQDVVDRSINAAVDSYRTEWEEVIEKERDDMMLPRDEPEINNT
jgi:hypothetical protein